MKSKIVFITLALAVFFTVVLACSHAAKKTEKHSRGISSSSESSLVESEKEKPVNPNDNTTASSPDAPANPGANSVASVNSNKITFADYYFGFNTQMLHGPEWSNSKFISAAKNLYPENLRYPGGTSANYWDWKTGWLLSSPDQPGGYKNIKPNPITLENFKLGIDATLATPVFVLNMLTSDLKYQLEMLHHAKDIGLEVKLIELGNEYHDKKEPPVVAKFPAARDYALEANKWIVAIRKDFPGVRIAVVGKGSSELNGDAATQEPNAERTKDWDKSVFANIKGADAVVFHSYVGPAVQANAGKNRVDVNKKNDAVARQAIHNAFQTNVESCLGSPFVKVKQLNEYIDRAVPKNMKVWYTEYNLFEKNLVVSGTWTHGLFVSLMSLLFFNVNQTELICNHNIATNARMGAIFNDANGFENHIEATRTTPLTYSAGGMCLSLVGQAMHGKTIAQQIDFTNTQMLKTKKTFTYPSLFGYKFTGDGKETAIIMNLDASPASIDLSKVASGALQYKTHTGDPLKQITDVKEITTNTGKLSGTLSLPAYSITLLY